MEAKKVILILLTIFIVGPLVFIGTCFPLGLFSFGMYSNYNTFVVTFVYALSITFAIWVVIAMSKRIARK